MPGASIRNVLLLATYPYWLVEMAVLGADVFGAPGGQRKPEEARA